MRNCSALIPAIFACVGLVSCGSATSYIDEVTDLPLKETKLASMSWQNAPLRANAQYVLFGAQSSKEQRARMGDYFFVNWYDASPESPTSLQMRYTQTATASKVLTKEIRFEKPRKSKGKRKTLIYFNGPLRAERGDILSWRLDLIVNDNVVDTRRSYMWED